MSNAIQICRICMSVNNKMFTLENTNMENLYHLLTQVYVDTEDGKPTTVCFLCYARLQQCDRLQQQAIKSNELLEQLLKGGFTEATANAILNNQYTSQDLQISTIYYLDLQPANCEDVNDEANDLISVKEEAIDEGCNVKDNLCIIQLKEGIKNCSHSSNSIQILKTDKTSHKNEEAQQINMKSRRHMGKGTLITNKQNFQKPLNNNEDEKVGKKIEKIWKKTKTNVVSNKQSIQTSIYDKDTQEENINSPQASVINTIIGEFQCNECGKQFSTKDILVDHILKCMKITETSLSDSQLTKADTVKSLLTEMYSCSICTFKTKRKLFMVTHLKMHNVTKVLSCNICEYRCLNKKQFKSHMRRHTGEKPFSCNTCMFKCSHKHYLKKHMRTHTGEKHFSCDICEYRCLYKHNLKYHMRRHTGEKPFSCHFCEYTCANKYVLIRHIRTHTGEKPFSCNICEFKCAQMSSFNRHMRKHTGEKPFSCNICEYKCAQKFSFDQHIKTHTGEKPFCCNICVYRCSRKYYLEEHMKKHTGEKPFSCSVCEYRCAQNGYLKRHMRTHTGEKPYSCNICEYRCSHKHHLIDHMRTHTGEKPFSHYLPPHNSGNTV